jgi:hypothetical protein
MEEELMHETSGGLGSTGRLFIQPMNIQPLLAKPQGSDCDPNAVIIRWTPKGMTVKRPKKKKKSGKTSRTRSRQKSKKKK